MAMFYLYSFLFKNAPFFLFLFSYYSGYFAKNYGKIMWHNYVAKICGRILF